MLTVGGGIEPGCGWPRDRRDHPRLQAEDAAGAIEDGGVDHSVVEGESSIP